MFEMDGKGQEYATLSCVAHEKNHPGESSHQDNEHIQRMYPTNTKLCPVQSLKSYMGHLHLDCTAFFQKPKTSVLKGK